MHRTLGATLLVAGCCIGAGMLGLPLVAVKTGFFPSCLALFISWLFMALTGLLLAEANRWFPEGAHLLTLAEKLLGKGGRYLTYALFMFLFYCLIVAYLAGGGVLVNEAVEALFALKLQPFFGPLFLVLCFGLPLIFGAACVDQVNRFLMVALFSAYFFVLLWGVPAMHWEQLEQVQFSSMFWLFPTMMVSFGFHNLVPTLRDYLADDVSALRRALVGGSAVALAVYVLWDGLILALFPPGSVVGGEEMVTAALRQAGRTDAILWLVHLFAFFAIVTSLLSVALSFVDFFADGLKVTKGGWNSVMLVGLVLVPPLVFALNFTHLFLVALNYAGAFGAMALFGLLPVAMVWKGRYIDRRQDRALVGGGETSVGRPFPFCLNSNGRTAVGRGGSVNRLIGGILLIAGTAIGAGMLALPIETGFAGFGPSLVLFGLYWAVMTYTAFLFLEVNLWSDRPGINMIGLAKMTLGPIGAAISWVAYLFLLYSLTTAYLAGGGALFNSFIGGILPHGYEPLPLALFFGACLYRGMGSVDGLNRLFMAGLIVTYMVMVVTLAPQVDKTLLLHVDMGQIARGSAIAATSFGFHIVIPTLVEYMHREVRQLRLALWIGCAIPVMVYLLWQWVVLGIIPLEGPISLSAGFLSGSNSAQLLSDYLGRSWMGEIASLFALFAIITSFLGVSKSLVDFLHDGLLVERTERNSLYMLFLTFMPPLFFVWMDPRAFLTALEYAGAFGVMVLLVLMPVAMAFVGRKKYSHQARYRVAGGTGALIGVTLFAFFVIVHELYTL